MGIAHITKNTLPNESHGKGSNIEKVSDPRSFFSLVHFSAHPLLPFSSSSEFSKATPIQGDISSPVALLQVFPPEELLGKYPHSPPLPFHLCYAGDGLQQAYS